MSRALLLLAVLPALLFACVTAWRVSLEVSDPLNPVMRYLSANALSMVWMFVLPALLLRSKLSLGKALLVAFVFFLLVRLPIGAVYYLAWEGQWAVEATGEPTRYVTDIREASSGEPSPNLTVILTTFFPIAFGLVFTFVLWSLYWAVAFRGKRPFLRGDAA